MFHRIAIASLVAFVAMTTACSANTSDDSSGSSTQDQTAGPVAVAPSSAAPANFVTVRPGLYRGGHPDAAALDYLKSLGVRRVLNLEVGDFIEAFPWDIDDEVSNTADRGMTDIRYPMSAFEAAASDRFDTNMDEMIALMKTATPDDPIYVHCMHGQDRTGLVIGMERVFDESWQPADAHAEMVKLGFHTGFHGLNEYFENKTGWED